MKQCSPESQGPQHQFDFPETFHDVSGEIVAVAGQERRENMDVKCVPARPTGKTKDPRHRKMRVRDEFPREATEIFRCQGIACLPVISTLAPPPPGQLAGPPMALLLSCRPQVWSSHPSLLIPGPVCGWDREVDVFTFLMCQEKKHRAIFPWKGGKNAGLRELKARLRSLLLDSSLLSPCWYWGEHS